MEETIVHEVPATDEYPPRSIKIISMGHRMSCFVVIEQTNGERIVVHTEQLLKAIEAASK